MAAMLRFYRGGLTVADYDALTWDRRERLYRVMVDSIEERQRGS